ncbi:hypothetical protein QVD17_11006 [Tagetes erecta]|uniref:Integrase catalytic domain-containing protein n=1 Tax=Tagetes erecta TaxID=13708 RepID=A0AAD8P5B0_TARER|nr:hypothetical protein QVD17_11006 [Tagetes erecta]
MALLAAFTTQEKTSHNSHKFAFTLNPNNHCHWKTMITPFLVTNNMFGYIDGSIPCPSPTIEGAPSTPATDKEPPTLTTRPNPNFTAWVSNDAHVRMILISTISEASYDYIQGNTARELWLTLERAYAPHTSSREFTLKTQLLKIEMKGDETPSAYLTRAQGYATALSNIGEPVKDKDLVMLVIAGLREEYNGLKSNLLARQVPIVFNELQGLLSDHDYLINKPTSTSTPSLAFNVTTDTHIKPSTSTSINPTPTQLSAIQQLASQFGYQLTTTNTPPQAYYSYRPPQNNNRGRGYNNNNNRGRGRGSTNRNNNNRSQFEWASNQNTVYGTCNRCGIGHIPSHCPNRDPSTVRAKPSANFADHRSSSSSTWFPDTGANSHVTPDLASLGTSEAYNGDDALHVGNGKGLPILHIGSSHIHSPHKTFSLANILHVPQIKKNLLSVQKFCLDNHVFFEFHPYFFLVKDISTHTTLLTGPSNNGLYTINLPQLHSINKTAFSAIRASSTIWHQRLGHPHHRLLQSMLSNYHLPVSNNLSSSFCNSCHMGKSTKLSLNNSSFRSSNVLDLIFCDVWGPAPTLSFDGHSYFMLCVDHYSRYMWIFHLKQKSDVYNTFKQFLSMVERKFNTKLKTVQTDWGGEFRNLSTFFKSLGITHRRSCPHTSEQNGIVERRHRHVVETGLTILAQSSAPPRFWHFAFDTAVYLINRMPARSNSNQSPYEIIHKRHPDLSFLKVFGCQCFPHLRPYNPHKMDLRSTPCIFLGYSPDHHGYRCLDPTTDRLYIARHARFNENHFPFQPQPTPQTPSPPPPSYTSFVPDPPIPSPETPLASQTPNTPCQTPPSNPPTSKTPTQTPPTTPPASKTPKTPCQTPTQTPPTTPPASTTPDPPCQTPPKTPVQQNTPNNSPTPPPCPPPPPPPPPPPTRPRPSNLRQHPKPRVPFDPSAFHTTTSPPTTTPTSFAIANKYPEWRQAMAEEYHALVKNGTWSLVPPVSNTNVVDCKWLYRLKHDKNGDLNRYKARLVAKGFSQQEGIDFHETFSPVIKPATIRTVLSLAVTNQWPLRQLDVKNAFLHGDLHETIYLKQPPGFVDPDKPDHVCLLHRSLYGLKQAPRNWFHRLSTVLQRLGFSGSKTDPSLFIYNSRGTLIYFLVYVDDIIITSNNTAAMNQVITQLGNTFDLKDLGTLDYFLGIEVVHQGQNIMLSQRQYIVELLQRAGLSAAKPVPSPMSTSNPLSLHDSPAFSDPVKYRQMVGALQYVTLSRPDVSFAVNKVCQFMHAPTENHWSAVKRILRYLLGTSNHGLLIKRASGSTLHAFTDAHWQDIQAYSDADWAGCPDDRRSTGGFAIYLGSNLISWTARKQRTVSRSSTESEYKALADTVAELTWLQALLRELGIPTKSAPTLWCDNLGATYLSANPVFHARTKHVEVDFHFVREKVAAGKLQVQYISTGDQIADIFTKPLATDRHIFLRSKLQVVTRP